MIIPIGTDNPLRSKPRVNQALVALNILIFMYTGAPGEHGTWAFDAYMSHPTDPKFYQFITSAFLHGSWMHVLGNMLFLYIFGNNVNDKLGNVGYIIFYLASAMFSDMGHMLTSVNPALGASGAVAAVTGAYMVLFPKTYIHVVYMLFFIGTMEVPALYFILFKLIIFDNVLQPKLYGGGNVAYNAHLAGYAIGVAIPLILLSLKLLPHSHYDLWALIKRWRQRQNYHSTVKDYNPYDPAGKMRQKVNVKVTDSEYVNPNQEKITALRAQIAEAFYANQLPVACEKYIQLLQLDNTHVLPQQQHLDISNTFVQIGRYEYAAIAYEIFLKSHSRYPFTEQVELMLGLVYSRYLKRPEQAKIHLANALGKLSEESQRLMCQKELDQL
ncbi:MAG: rhomboid family intramembrane serine protease [Phycisphaerae bacterium]|nr:rhomboid family intramembrane serine protease [Phycisphaerae bacterium]